MLSSSNVAPVTGLEMKGLSLSKKKKPTMMNPLVIEIGIHFGSLQLNKVIQYLLHLGGKCARNSV